jgi:GrpB-like predicted nucleotidyltransferase (UPF0157 family)
VPGLSAKPIIDLDVIVASPNAFNILKPPASR